MSKSRNFAICVANEGFDDLEVWKVYRVLPDAKTAGVGCIRVIDESGEDYLYPADRFAEVDIPSIARSRLPEWQPSRGKSLPAATRSCGDLASDRAEGLEFEVIAAARDTGAKKAPVMRATVTFSVASFPRTFRFYW